MRIGRRRGGERPGDRQAFGERSPPRPAHRRPGPACRRPAAATWRGRSAPTSSAVGPCGKLARHRRDHRERRQATRAASPARLASRPTRLRSISATRRANASDCGASATAAAQFDRRSRRRQRGDEILAPLEDRRDRLLGRRRRPSRIGAVARRRRQCHGGCEAGAISLERAGVVACGAARLRRAGRAPTPRSPPTSAGVGIFSGERASSALAASRNSAIACRRGRRRRCDPRLADQQRRQLAAPRPRVAGSSAIIVARQALGAAVGGERGGDVALSATARRQAAPSARKASARMSGAGG